MSRFRGSTVRILLCRSNDKDKGNATSWDFDADSSSSVTMVRPSKSKETEPTGANHTPNHHGQANGEVGGQLEDVDGGENKSKDEQQEESSVSTPDKEQPPQLGIDETAFVSTGQRSSVVSASGEGEKRRSVVAVGGNSGLVVVSIAFCAAIV